MAKTVTNGTDHSLSNGTFCENVVGYVKVPVSVVGPLLLDDEETYVPLATTEGALVPSTNRGMSALYKSGGVSSRIKRDFMTRAPIVRFPFPVKNAVDNVERATSWLLHNKDEMAKAFNETSNYAKFHDYTMTSIGRTIHIRFEAETGDAMGMNMVTKGVERALQKMQETFPTMEIHSLSGNTCSDKKAAAINWTRGRGKDVECNAVLPANVVQQVLKVSVDSMIDLWKSKVMIGSAIAASVGGFNCHAANVVSAIFIATGQDPAQCGTSSNCILELEKDPQGSLAVHCSMPSIECGTIGGGTILGDQSHYLQMMGLKQSNSNGTTAHPSTGSLNVQYSRNRYDTYTDARKLARIICASVMAAELSLMASLVNNTLVKAHMRYNRSSTNVTETRPTDGSRQSSWPDGV